MSEFNAYRESSALSCAAMAELAKNEAAMMIDRNNEWLNRQPHIMPGATAETRRESEEE